ncbi:hypothetical protein BRD02_07765 [Halobacteriales archaeon QS_8_69_73]|nr:MAG: hypothetical protein BRD02_07765 [Halobacteriales archaeon QS_8_69_73]
MPDILAENLSDKEVMGSDGASLGTLYNITMDLKTGTLRNLVVDPATATVDPDFPRDDHGHYLVFSTRRRSSTTSRPRSPSPPSRSFGRNSKTRPATGSTPWRARGCGSTSPTPRASTASTGPPARPATPTPSPGPTAGCWRRPSNWTPRSSPTTTPCRTSPRASTSASTSSPRTASTSAATGTSSVRAAAGPSTTTTTAVGSAAATLSASAHDILRAVNGAVSSPTWESWPVYDSPEATFPSR